MLATPVADGIWWVGAIDWNLRDFHGYETPRGTTYNAYLVRVREDRARRHREDPVRARAALAHPVDRPARGDRLHRGEPHRARSQQRASRGHGGDAASEGRRVAGRRARASPSTTTALSRRRRQGRHHRPWRQDAHVPARADGPLARLDVHVLPRGLRPHAQRRVRSAPRHPPSASPTRSASSRDGGAQTSTTRTSCCRFGTQVGKAVEKIKELGWVCHVIAPSHGVMWRGVDILQAPRRLRRVEQRRAQGQGRRGLRDDVGLDRRAWPGGRRRHHGRGRRSAVWPTCARPRRRRS